jgi:hypothetical protein
LNFEQEISNHVENLLHGFLEDPLVKHLTEMTQRLWQDISYFDPDSGERKLNLNLVMQMKNFIGKFVLG